MIEPVNKTIIDYYRFKTILVIFSNQMVTIIMMISYLHTLLYHYFEQDINGHETRETVCVYAC